MPQPSPVSGVVFDLDGTLYDKRPLEREMLRRMPRHLVRLWRYTKVRSSMAGLDLGSHDALFEEALRRLGPQPRRARWRRWIREVYDPGLMHALGVCHPYPAVRPLLLALRQRGVRVGLVSDYAGADERLRRLGLPPETFHFRMVTETRGAMKPAPRMVAEMLAGMRLPASSLVMVGDRHFTDGTFAQAAGMDYLGVTPGVPKAGYASFAEVDRRLRARFGLHLPA